MCRTSEAGAVKRSHLTTLQTFEHHNWNLTQNRWSVVYGREQVYLPAHANLLCLSGIVGADPPCSAVVPPHAQVFTRFRRTVTPDPEGEWAQTAGHMSELPAQRGRRNVETERDKGRRREEPARDESEETGEIASDRSGSTSFGPAAVSSDRHPPADGKRPD